MRPLLVCLIAASCLPARAEELHLSTDGGRTWEARGPRDHVLTALTPDTRDPASAWAVAQPTAASLPAGENPKFASPVLLHTSDGGKTWEKNSAYRGADPVCVAIDPSNSSTIYVGGWFESISRSTDGGRTWQKLDLGELGKSRPQTTQNTSRNVGSIAIKGDSILACFEHVRAGFLALSEDAGKTWRQIHDYACMSCVFFGDRIVACGSAWRVVSSGDLGKTWVELRKICCQSDGGYSAFSLSPDGKELLFVCRDIAMSCRPGEDWKTWEQPAPDEAIMDTVLLGKEVLALVRKGEFWDHRIPGRPHFRERGGAQLKARDASGQWTLRRLPEGGEPKQLLRSCDGSAVWLLTR